LSQRVKRVSGQPLDQTDAAQEPSASRAPKPPGQTRLHNKAVVSRSAREQMFKDAVIEFAGGGRESVVVKNLSLTGARIDASHGLSLPDRLRISIPAIGLYRSARVVWQDHQSAGIVFE
jgi:hypothetical protein